MDTIRHWCIGKGSCWHLYDAKEFTRNYLSSSCDTGDLIESGVVSCRHRRHRRRRHPPPFLNYIDTGNDVDLVSHQKKKLLFVYVVMSKKRNIIIINWNLIKGISQWDVFENITLRGRPSLILLFKCWTIHHCTGPELIRSPLLVCDFLGAHCPGCPILGFILFALQWWWGEAKEVEAISTPLSCRVIIPIHSFSMDWRVLIYLPT